MKIFIKTLNDFADITYKTNEEQIARNDSGYDLYVCEKIIVEPFKTAMIGLGIACEPNFNGGYYLYPRSSISKTPLALANSVGIIDAGYRGEIEACVRNLSSEQYTIEKGTKLFQLCMYDLKPFNIVLMDTLTDTVRGSGGFGSTNI